MPAVTSRAQRIGHPIAIIAIIAATLIFLSPIYWIASTAFKPRAVATSVPPTVFFTPEVTPFIKLFTKRVLLKEEPAQEVYDAAPWWEKAIFDGGERVLRVGDDVQFSQYPNRFFNSLVGQFVVAGDILDLLTRVDPFEDRACRDERLADHRASEGDLRVDHDGLGVRTL